MKYKLPAEIYAPQQVSAEITTLKQLLRQQEHARVKAQVSGVEFKTDREVEPKIQQLETILDKAPRVQVTLAAMPSEGLKRELVGWLRQNINSSVLVEFNYNSALMGGMVIRVGSRIFDWSFRRQIMAAAPNFTKVLRNV